MIRHFAKLCKALLDKLTDEAIFQNATGGYSCKGERCPKCGAKGSLSGYGDYPRNLVSHMDGQNVERRVRPIRFKCALCGSTHALLPYVLVPYSPFSLRFMLCALAAYFERGTTVLAVCQRFGIAVSTLYEWKGRLLRHMGVLLGILGDLEERAPAFIAGLLASARAPRMLDGFYQRLGFSFMQRIRAAARGRPP